MSLKQKAKITCAVLVVASVGLFAFSGAGERYFEIAKSLDIFTTLYKEVDASYINELDPNETISTGINAMLESLDPYTDYIPEENMEAFSIQTTGSYAGIGALIGVVNKRTVITEPYEGFPAYRAGIRVGDELISIDGKVAEGKNTNETSAMLKGRPNTEVEIVVRRSGQKDDLHFKLVREKIKITNVVYQGMATAEIGLIKLNDFTPGAGMEVQSAVAKLKEQGAKKIILDLRENPGGLLYEAVNIVNVFIPKGLEVVSTKGKVQEWNKSYTTLNAPLDTDIPLAVLASQGSASASEIVAGSLQDYDRGVLIGQRTFGKGLVQTTRQLGYNVQLKVTTARYYIPSGRCIQALDYAHRKNDGTVERFADSLKAEFKTKSGRKVYDGGGLDPDVPVKNEFVGSLSTELIASGLVFEYATYYCGEHPAVPATMKSFSLSDAEYAKFIEWLKAKNFSYVTDLEKQVENLIITARDEKVYNDLQGQLTALKTKMEQSHISDLTRFKEEIKRILEQQISFHYRLEAGQAEVSLSIDPEVKEAIRVLSDGVAYKKLLAPH